jgi:hypothetical protein
MQDGYDQTLSGLLRKRAELAGEVEEARRKWEASGSALDAIDAAIRVFSPNIAPEDLPEKRQAPAYTGGTSEIQRFMMDMLRRTGKPIRTLEAAAAVMAERHLDPRDRVTATLIRKRCADSFGKLRAKGIVTGEKYGSGSELEWRLL